MRIAGEGRAPVVRFLMFAVIVFAVLVLALASPPSAAAAGGRQAGPQGCVSAASAGAEASRLVKRLRAFTLENPSDPSALPQWSSAVTGQPLLIRLLDGTPSEYVVPVIDTEGRAISIIGVGAASGRWRWYSGRYEEGGFPPIGADEAAARVREFLREKGIPGAITAPEARLAPDKRLYWHVRPEGFLPLYDVYLPAFERGKPRTNLDKPPWKLERFTGTDGRDIEAVTTTTRRPGAPAGGERRAAESSGGAAQAHEIPDVPYHEQQESYWCGPASLEMVFDYWGDDIPQSEIAAVANASSSYGVYANELARAAHFSGASTAIQDPSLSGYTGRSVGYGMAAASWRDGSSLYSRRFDDLKNIVAHDYPVLVLTDYNDGLNSGHFRVVKGYDDRLGTFTVHDPWYSPQPYAGPDVKFEQSFFVDRLWQYSDRWGMIAAPWSVTVSKPAYVSEGQSFTVSARVTYRGVEPFSGEAGVVDPVASLEAPSNGYQVTGGQVSTPVEGLDRMESTGTATWTVRALSSRLTDDIGVAARGTVEGATSDYPRYTDWIGGTGSTGGAPPFTPTSRTWGHDSVGVSAASEVWYLAEGCTNGGFETWVLVQNPNPTPANISLTYMTKGGAVPGPGANLPANSRMTFNVAETVPGQWSVSTMVNSDEPVVAERSMYGGMRTWGHDSVGVSAASEVWYLAEGCTNGGFETWVLVQNPNPTPANISLTYMTGGGAVPGPGANLPANSRMTFNVADTVPGQWSVSTMVNSDEPVVAERSMYGGMRTWGHDSVGVSVASEVWYLAEGCTNGGFETWVLVQNPNPTPANISLTYMTKGGAVPGPGANLPANSRMTFNVAETVPGQWSVSTMVNSDEPVVAERSMYGGMRTWGHDSVGVSAASEVWYLAEGCTNGGFETWVLVQNPNPTPANISLTYMTKGGAVPGPGANLPANSRMTFNVADTVPGQWSVSTMVNSDKPVVAERSMYGDPL